MRSPVAFGVSTTQSGNLPINAGVQMELPPTIRWNKEAMNWSDHEGTPRAPQVDALIETLVVAVETWQD